VFFSADVVYVVDANTSFGGIPLDMRNIDILTGSAYKCLQGVPGIAYVIASEQLILM